MTGSARNHAVLPPFAYVPGRTARHDPAFFEPFHASVRPGAGWAELTASAAWTTGLFWLEHGYYWECHEALEPVWMQTAPGAPERELVQGVIQLANAALKAQMERPRAVSRLCGIATRHFAAAGPARATLSDAQWRGIERLLVHLRSELTDE